MRSHVFPIITKEIQKEYEAVCPEESPAELPMICGYKGRACRQMDKEEGANRFLCNGCPLAEYAEGR